MQYMDQIDILRGFIKSEQVGNWVMQVQTIKVMPPNLQGVGWGVIVQNIYVFLQAYDGWQKYSKSPGFS